VPRLATIPCAMPSYRILISWICILPCKDSSRASLKGEHFVFNKQFGGCLESKYTIFSHTPVGKVERCQNPLQSSAGNRVSCVENQAIYFKLILFSFFFFFFLLRRGRRHLAEHKCHAPVPRRIERYYKHAQRRGGEIRRDGTQRCTRMIRP
jgi:hypothetical protein